MFSLATQKSIHWNKIIGCFVPILAKKERKKEAPNDEHPRLRKLYNKHATNNTHLSILFFVTEQLVHAPLDTVGKDELLKYIIQTRRIEFIENRNR